ncbi:hypothetical protein SAMN05660461_1359 [Chitinophaga ginsengisegetis]|uniref:Uncharacterized protein n=1 Tax=Chitinophaga ginsengisegetis TaxID=393003 RepID=A0A1T5NF88_9BACT|nr:hypothetical protein [Chitinophaga ginsengisegetis]MDR6571064.1 hypothetical protein [Chitinophaga ginsengisegetis]MDR6650798.1 hypothetical protein [Chitinophaga ginsengisegetis]MDR6657182.1 hypothetical protein [Chitinophaga ginsengisegetis]SKC99077.1 hypothetical protein SAMN05660461_1359 [Chitinophaga ginsengisegetis]
MKHFIVAILLISLVAFSCKKVKYEWEEYTYTAVPVVTIDTTKTALPTRQAGKVAFFNLKDPDVASQQFAFTLSWEGFGKETVTSIEVYTSYNKAETSVPAYPLVISSPGNQYTNIAQFPLPSIVGTNDHLYETVTTFPKTYSFTAAQLATLNNVSLSNVGVNDYFLFKFILNLADGRRIVTFFNNICDEARGEPGDCRVGVRFKKQ